MDTGDIKDSKKKPPKKGKQGKSSSRWAVQVFFIAVTLSAVLSFASDQALDGAGLAVAFVVLLAFILLGIVFDIIGVSVTAADEKPFHSMAARKTPGARESTTTGLTIGGKALGKSFAIAKSTAVLQLVGRFLHLFSRKKR